jgi:hypothetical protein
MLARLVAVAAPLLGASFAPAQPAGRVTEYGIYSAERKLLMQTHEIPIRAGVRFGFCFEVPVDSTDEAAMLVETLAHPPVQLRGIEDTGYSVPRMFRVEGGRAKGCSGYVARSESELAAGRWRFSLSDGGGDVVVQEFSVR